jgi:putative membrane protein
MPMNAFLPILAGLGTLAIVWGGPLPALVQNSLAAHMTMHMGVVGLGAPLIAIGIAARLGKNSALARSPILPIFAGALDLVVIWAWHAPTLHHLARSEPLVLAIEQASFGIVALVLWTASFCGPALAGAISLFFTSMHMTLLGTLLSLATQPIFPQHGVGHSRGFSVLVDQQLGGVIMLGAGGAVYLIGGLVLVQRVLRRSSPS